MLGDGKEIQQIQEKFSLVFIETLSFFSSTYYFIINLEYLFCMYWNNYFGVRYIFLSDITPRHVPKGNKSGIH